MLRYIESRLQNENVVFVIIHDEKVQSICMDVKVPSEISWFSLRYIRKLLFNCVVKEEDSRDQQCIRINGRT